MIQKKALGVATPRNAFLPGAAAEALPDFYPGLIKPNKADGSLSITMDSVMRGRARAEAYLAWPREALPGEGRFLQTAGRPEPDPFL